VPFAVPMILGLTGSLVSVIPMSCGIFLYYVILYVKQNGSFLAGSEQTEITQMLAQVIKNLLANPAMLVMIAACCLGALTVCVLKKLSINYSWGIAIGAGLILQILVVFIGDFRFGVPVSVPELVVGMIGAVIASLIYQLFVFSVDYSRTEYTQFEDDDYYYYVKAVPKIAISRTDVKVQEINKVKRR